MILVFPNYFIIIIIILLVFPKYFGINIILYQELC